MPKKVSKGSDNTEYIYDAAGNKLAKKVNGKFINFYCGSIVYDGDKEIDYIIHPEGLVQHKIASGKLLAYQYNITDHLGNVRAVTDESNWSIQQNIYYPFGLVHNTSSLDKNKYLYNGKEIQNDVIGGIEYRVLDYHARSYDPYKGRFDRIDPLAEKNRRWGTYVYCINNPLRFIDPDGMDEWEVNEKGVVKWIKESSDHTMYAVNEGKRTGQSLTLENRNIFDQLTEVKGKINIVDAQGTVLETREKRVAKTDENDGDNMMETFLFMADNTKVEWNVSLANIDGQKQYGLATNGLKNRTTPAFEYNELITLIHSHPTSAGDIKSEQYSMGGDRENSLKANRKHLNDYVYIVSSTRLYQVKDGKSTYVKHINGDYKRFPKMK